MSSLTTLLASTDPDGPALVDGLDGLASSISSFLAPMLILLASVMFIMGGIRIVKNLNSGYSDGSGWIFLIMGALAAGGAVLFPWLLGSFTPETSPSPQPTSTPSPTTQPTTAPEPTTEPADLTWLLVVLGIIGALILTAVLIWILIAATGRARRSIRAARREAEVERAGRERIASAWQVFHDRHNELLRKIVHSETDWDSLFFLPALTDPNVPQTYAMLRAMRAAGTQRDTAGELPADLPLDVDLTTLPYPKAVEAFAVAWYAAERNARRLGQKGVPHAERKIIKEIRTLLDMAENAAASSTERSLAYRRAQKLIDSLETVHVPEKAIAQLEERQQLMITAS
ncbi:MAG: hypothetical protein ABS81_08545 [Pseudonocardia sp. SCN 72-86]|uniref:hypothetical protein n=1 Tax=uncultured Microbacterium sp. TaxID=191216 RepID=UPI00086E32A1|nr:hypothetical protein [uncultured Microbacterium sp.]ODU05063.1 MAG: hypothetical protein ABS81_08545 [Pseudonocardia sp. SCN 72-86]